MNAEEFLNEYRKHYYEAEIDFAQQISNHYDEPFFSIIFKLRKFFNKKDLNHLLFNPLQELAALKNLLCAAEITADTRLFSLFRIQKELSEDEIKVELLKQEKYLEQVRLNVPINHIIKLINLQVEEQIQLTANDHPLIKLANVLDTPGMQQVQALLKGFSNEQKAEILLGLFDPMVRSSVYLYTDKAFSTEQMQFIRNYLLDRGKPKDKVIYLLQPERSIEQLKLFSEAIDNGFSHDQLLELSLIPVSDEDRLKGLVQYLVPQDTKITNSLGQNEPTENKKETNRKKIDYTAFTKEQLLEITQVQHDHLPDECIEYLANPEIPYQLMRAIRVLLSKNVPFSEIKDYLIKNQKKQAIWIGLYNLKR